MVFFLPLPFVIVISGCINVIVNVFHLIGLGVVIVFVLLVLSPWYCDAFLSSVIGNVSCSFSAGEKGCASLYLGSRIEFLVYFHKVFSTQLLNAGGYRLLDGIKLISVQFEIRILFSIMNSAILFAIP